MNGKKISAVIVAGGKGLRMGSQTPKQFLKLEGKPVIEHTIDSFLESGLFNKIVIVCNKDYIKDLNFVLSKIVTEVEILTSDGGETRQESVYNGLKLITDSDFVMIHDAVRCLVTPDLLDKLALSLDSYNACALGVKVKDTIKIADCDGFISETPDRNSLWQIQTPQCFKTEDIIKFHESAKEKGLTLTDDCALAEECGQRVKIIEGSDENIKVTTPFDMVLASEIIKRRKSL